MENLNGYLLVDKPAGWTSFDVVAKIRSILRIVTSRQSSVSSGELLVTRDKRLATPSPKVKVGHTGTLDPFATGLLIIVVGSYCKRAGEFSKLDKIYEAEIILGATSTTGDPEGEITKNEEWRTKNGEKKPSQLEVEEILKSFVGEIEQVPHKFSAIKVDGQRAYKLARAGKEVKLEPRKVTVYGLEVTEYKYPTLKIVAEVSSGTYIRSLAEDIGQKLGTGAYLSALRRTKVGNFRIENAKTIDELIKYEIINHIGKV